MKIYLLTHELEHKRKTNTGSIAIEFAGEVVERIIWQRVHPDKKLVALIDDNKALLLHPTALANANSNAANIGDYENIIVIDGTWQESQKIYNKSHYLKRAPVARLRDTGKSEYRLRRNQPTGGLCTIECIMEVLKSKNAGELAMKLEREFLLFNKNDQ